MRKRHCRYTGIPWDFGPWVSQRAGRLEKPQEEPGRAQGRGVRGKDQVPKSPQGKGFSCLLKEKIIILGNSVAKGTVSSDDPQAKQSSDLYRSERICHAK